MTTNLEEFLHIETPENVAFNYEVAGMATRCFAGILDTLIILLIQVIVYISLFSLLSLNSFLFENENLPGWVIAIVGLIGFALLWGYYLFFELRWNGQSPGKRWLHLRVVRVDGMPITFTESLIRNLVRLIDFLPAYYTLGCLVMFLDKQTRRLGDLAAGTVVIRDQAPITLESIGRRPTFVPASESAVTVALPVERLTAQDIHMLEDFLSRNDMATPYRDAIGQRLFKVMALRLDLPEGWGGGISIHDRLRLILQAVHIREQHADGD